MTMDDFRKLRGMPFVKRGMRVKDIYRNIEGRIAGANSSCNLNVIFDGYNHSENCHPRWMMQYFDKNGTLIKEYKD